MDNTNILFLTEDKFARLGKYIGKNKNIFKCPSDIYVRPRAANPGAGRSAFGAFPDNIGIGDGNAETGPWDGLYKHIKKTGQFISPGPTETWVDSG